MTITTSATTAGPSLRHPVSTGAIGLAVYAAAMAAGEAFNLNADPAGNGTTAGEWMATGMIALAGLVVGVAVGVYGWNGSPGRLAGTALGLAIVGAVLFVAFWSGWPAVFSAVAVGLAVEHRRRIGSFGTGTGAAVTLAAVAFVAVAFLCVTG